MKGKAASIDKICFYTFNSFGNSGFTTFSEQIDGPGRVYTFPLILNLQTHPRTCEI